MTCNRLLDDVPGFCCPCNAVHFTCPSCEARHDRGYLDGASLFRCLKCGYVGYGYHVDAAIDAGVAGDVHNAELWNKEHGIRSLLMP